MKIVIAGAGDIGFYLAKNLSYEKQDIVLIDLNQEVLDYVQSHLDVMTIKGDSASLEILESANIARADLFLAVTTSEKNNLISSIIAKKMGARQTIARVSNPEFLDEDERTNFKELGIDSIISPLRLAAGEINRLVKQETLTDVFDFEEGKITLLGLTLEEGSTMVNKTISSFQEGELICKPIALLRGNNTMLPEENTVMLPNDHLYFITKKEMVDEITQMVGKRKKNVRNIMIVGGGEIGFRTAELLESSYHVTLIEKDKNTCKELIEKLHHTLVVKGDYTNFELLKEEGLDGMDAFIALTNNTETNILSSLMAKNFGVNKTIALVENVEYTHISQNVGVDTLINIKLIAANNIFRYVRKGQIEAITSLHGVNAEVIEFVITKNNRVTRKPLRELHLPSNVIIAAVIRGNESMIVDENFQLKFKDKVIVFTMPESIHRVEKLFH